MRTVVVLFNVVGNLSIKGLSIVHIYTLKAASIKPGDVGWLNHKPVGITIHCIGTNTRTMIFAK